MSNDCPVYERGFKCVVVVESWTLNTFNEFGDEVSEMADAFEFEAPFIVPMPFSAPR